MGYGLRNVVDKRKALEEILGVLKPGFVQCPFLSVEIRNNESRMQYDDILPYWDLQAPQSLSLTSTKALNHLLP